MVAISHDHKFIFLKTRKTAGSSIEAFLHQFCAPPEAAISRNQITSSTHGIIGMMDGSKINLRKRTPWYRPIWYHHMSAKEVSRQLGQKKFRQYLKISAVRNPFDRTVSFFHFRNRKTLDGSEDFSVLRKRFNEFVKNGGRANDSKVVLLKHEYIIDEMVRFEHLPHDIKQVCDKLDIPFDQQAFSHEKSMRKTRKDFPVADYFEAESINVVKSRMKWVFDHFDYPTHPAEAV